MMTESGIFLANLCFQLVETDSHAHAEYVICAEFL